MTSKKEKLIIIDGNALIHRSFHALPPTITTTKGEVVNAVYGFANVLLKAIKELKPGYIVLTLDKKGPTFRHKEYKEYKATRVKAPDELYKQIPRVKELVESFGIPVYELTGFEADDLIGTIASQVDENVEKIILTGDMDTLQLVNDHTHVYTLSRGLTDSVIYDSLKVKERYGLTVEQMIDYKALRGDPSDNIPGVKGIGEKTATELLQNFRTLEKLYNSINKSGNGKQALGIKPRIIELLKLHEQDALMSKKLARIETNAPIKFDLNKSKFGDFNQDEVFKLFSELEFKSLLPRVKDLRDSKSGIRNQELGQDKNSKKENLNKFTDKFKRNEKLFKYKLVNNEKDLNAFLIKLNKQKEFAYDTEISSFDIFNAELLGISFSWKESEAYFLSTKNSISQPGKQEFKSQNLFNYSDKKKAPNNWLEKLKPIFENEKIKKYGHNIKFDIKVLWKYGIKPKGIYGDTMIASYLLSPGTRQHNLDAVTFTELGFEKISKSDLLGTGRDKITFAQVATEKLANYSCEDADFTYRLAKKLLPQIKKAKLEKLFFDMEMPLVEILAMMENNGIKINAKYLSKMSAQVHERVKKLEKEICKLAGADFNINSTQQLREVLFEKLNLPTQGITKTKTGLSTGADELAKLINYHPIIELIQEHRELMKLLNTYIDALPEIINKKTGRVHTSYNQAVTATGRLSSTEPNLQNIPIRTELGREIREAFIAEKGYKLVSLDYSQIELRLAAHMSGDQKMIKAFKDGVDIHAATAAEINGVELEKVTKEMRREAKATNFGILYGQGPHGLSQTAGIPYARAKEFIDNYFEVYRGIKEYMDKTLEMARSNGYVETLFGRKRYLPEINSSMVMVRKGAERMAINTPIQGTAADMIKASMVKICQTIPELNNAPLVKGVGGIKLLLQVHDELLFEIKENQAEEFTPKLKKIMENIIKLDIPVVVDVKTGDDWGNI